MVNGGEGLVKEACRCDTHETDSGIHSGDDIVDRVSGGEARDLGHPAGEGHQTWRDVAEFRDPPEDDQHAGGDVAEFLRRQETMMDVLDLEEVEDKFGKQRDKSWEGLPFSLRGVEDLEVINLDEDGWRDKEEWVKLDKKFSRERRKTPTSGHREPEKKNLEKHLNDKIKSDDEIRLQNTSLLADKEDESSDVSLVSSEKSAKTEESVSAEVDEIKRVNRKSEKGKIASESDTIEPEEAPSRAASRTSVSEERPQQEPATADVSLDSPTENKCFTTTQNSGTNPEIRVPDDTSVSDTSDAHSRCSSEESTSPRNSSPTKKFVSKSLSDGNMLPDSTRVRFLQRMEVRVPRRGVPCSLDIQEELPEDMEDVNEREHRESRARLKELVHSRCHMDTLTVPGERRASRGVEPLCRGPCRGSLVAGRDDISLSSPSSPEDEEARRNSQTPSDLSSGREVSKLELYYCYYYHYHVESNGLVTVARQPTYLWNMYLFLPLVLTQTLL